MSNLFSSIKKSASAAVLLPLVLLTACSSVPEGAQLDPPMAEQLSKHRDELPAKYAYGQLQFDGRQGVGLALSGGGTKAAIFAHGVLAGLNDAGILQHIDAISTTSGGGYAAYWYFSKRMEIARLNAQRKPGDPEIESNAMFAECFHWIKSKEGDSTEEKVIERVAITSNKSIPGCETLYSDEDINGDTDQYVDGDPYRWQAHLLRWPQVFRTDISHADAHPPKPLKNEAHLVNDALLGMPEALLHRPSKDSDIALAYEYGIERTWGLNPQPRKAKPIDHTDALCDDHDEKTYLPGCWQYTNSARMILGAQHVLGVDANTSTWELLADMTKVRAVPLWILNTNIGKKNHEPDLRNLFEITPLGMSRATENGSPQSPTPQSAGITTLARGVRASAAFADAQGLTKASERDILQAVVPMLPAAQWGVSITYNKEDIRLSDGGGSDNLALINLVKRGFRDIIIVDAEQDGTGAMEDLCRDWRALQKEGLKMDFPALLRFQEVCTKQFDHSFFSEKLAYNVSAWTEPVIKGSIVCASDMKSCGGKEIRLWLIKSAWDQQAIRQRYNNILQTVAVGPGHVSCGTAKDLSTPACELLLFYAENSSITNPLDGYMLFPQHGTASSTLGGSINTTIAYKALGRTAAQQLTWNSPSGLAFADKQTPICAQPAWPITSGRPEYAPVTDTPTPCITIPKELTAR